MDADAAPRILIARLSALGDCILTAPVASALREHYPRAWIAWVTQAAYAPMMERHPAVNQVITVSKAWMRSPQQAARLRSKLREFRFDISIDPQSLTKSALTAWLSGAPQRIGFARPVGREIAPLLNNQTVLPSTTHVVDRYLELLQPLGVPLRAAIFELPADSASRRFAAQCVDALHLRTGYVVINPGAGWGSKIWPAERYGTVARWLGERFSLPSLVVWSGDRERAWAETIVARSGGHAILAPATTVPQLAALLSVARLFVGSDTGPLHLAAAAGTPCVGLFGPTRPEICGPYGACHRTVQAFYQDGSSRERRGNDNRAMQAISIEMVCEASADVLSRTRERAA